MHLIAPDLRTCPDCPRTFPSRSALRRHAALDHRPAPDGAELLARIVGSPSSDASTDQPAEQPPPAQEAARPLPAARPTPVRGAVLLVLLAAAAFAGATGLVLLLGASLLIWCHRVRSQVLLGEDGDGRTEGRRPSAA